MRLVAAALLHCKLHTFSVMFQVLFYVCIWQECRVVKLACVWWFLGCCIAEEVDPYCYKLCSYDGLWNADDDDLLICTISLRRIAACGTGKYVFHRWTCDFADILCVLIILLLSQFSNEHWVYCIIFNQTKCFSHSIWHCAKPYCTVRHFPCCTVPFSTRSGVK